MELESISLTLWYFMRCLAWRTIFQLQDMITRKKVSNCECKHIFYARSSFKRQVESSLRQVGYFCVGDLFTNFVIRKLDLLKIFVFEGVLVIYTIVFIKKIDNFIHRRYSVSQFLQTLCDTGNNLTVALTITRLINSKLLLPTPFSLLWPFQSHCCCNKLIKGCKFC